MGEAIAFHIEGLRESGRHVHRAAASWGAAVGPLLGPEGGFREVR
jgi:hypothetical protein